MDKRDLLVVKDLQVPGAFQECLDFLEPRDIVDSQARPHSHTHISREKNTVELQVLMQRLSKHLYIHKHLYIPSYYRHISVTHMSTFIKRLMMVNKIYSCVNLLII